MTAKKEPATEAAPKAAPQKPKGPTPKELEQIKDGGDYLFNPDTRKFTPKRKPTVKPEPGQAGTQTPVKEG